MEPSVFFLLFPVFYIILAVDLFALGAIVAFLIADVRMAREYEWPLVVVEEERRAA